MRPEPCPDCGAAIEIAEVAIERRRTRCQECALDVELIRQEHGDGPARVSSFLTLRAPALQPASRLRVERNHARLAIALAPASKVAIAGAGLGAGVAVTAAGLAGALPLVAAAVSFVALLAGGFVLASQERSDLHILVEPTAIEINGARRAAPATCAGVELDPNGALSESELRWLRAVIDARLAGDRDAHEMATTGRGRR